MKICPFISHMIGEDQAGVLEFQDESNHDATHLFCLKESCRFYRSNDAECSFDVTFRQVDAQSKSGLTSEALDTVTSELNKFWTLQTRSVAELIESIGETEKNSKKGLERLEKSIAATVEKAVSEQGGFDTIEDTLKQLHEAISSREDGLEALSSTVSEVVMNIDDRLTELREASAGLAERVEKLESSLPSRDDIRGWIEESLASSQSEGNGEDLRSLSERFQSFVESSSRFEARLDQWQQQINSHVGEIRDGQSAFAETLDEIVAARAEESAREKESETTPERRRKARKLNNLGVTSFHNNDLELARDQFEEAVALDDGFAECFNNLGLVYTELGEEQKATEAFSKAIKINPDLHAAYNNLGYVFYKQGDYDQAVEMYNEALGRSASNSSAYTNLGNAYFKQGKHDDARGAWEKALELDPSNRVAGRSLKELDRETV